MHLGIAKCLSGGPSTKKKMYTINLELRLCNHIAYSAHTKYQQLNIQIVSFFISQDS